MTAPLHPARWPVRPHLRPKDGWRLCTEADVRPEILRRYPNVVDEFNAIEVWVGGSCPGREWDGPTCTRIPLAEALALPVGGEA